MAATMISQGLTARPAFAGASVRSAARSAAPAGRAGLVVRAATNWLPGAEKKSYLDGLPGNWGFDPLGLGENPESLKWYVQAELQNARWAMLGAAGILGPELFSKIGISWPGKNVPWTEAGKFPYFAPFGTLVGIEFFLFAWVEIRRWQDMKNPGSVNQDPIFSNNKLPDGNEPGYPGGIFDPFNWSKGNLADLKERELKNGRLAMFSMAGFFAQAFTTGTTPLNNLAEHLSDPWKYNVWGKELARALHTSL